MITSRNGLRNMFSSAGIISQTEFFRQDYRIYM